MSSVVGEVVGKPKRPRIPEQPDPVQEIEMIEEEAEVAKRKERKRLLTGGRRATVLSGIMSALKKRLGE